MTITSLLIANRGEIACRIIRTARRLGIRTIAVFSDADAKAPHVQEADDAVHIGPSPVRESYLAADKIIAAAQSSGANAIHPGYGFLSESADFADAVVAAGLIWVGPKSSSIRAMGLKDAAKKLMRGAGVRVTPGYFGADQSLARLQREADAIGYPVLIKAVAGGGGKGMRKVETAADFPEMLQACQREATSSFGESRVLIEKYIQRPRHIEVQVFGDTKGNIVHLFERDCSLQRRHQKVIEEAPAPCMDETTRTAICETAVRAARAVDYVGAGTVEFIADASEGLRPDRIWFMEMNTRLQVEHPVTESITGQDLVEWQLRVAAGERLPRLQHELRIDGHAIEARLYAEDPSTGFLPSIGKLERFVLPDDRARVDTGVMQGGEISPFYDPMIAKIIVWEESRARAASNLAKVARSVQIWPVKTNAAFLVRALDHPDFIAGDIHTGFIETHLAQLIPPDGPTPDMLCAVAWGLIDQSSRLAAGGVTWREAVGFRMNAPVSTRPVRVAHEGKIHEVALGTRRPCRAYDMCIWLDGLLVADNGQTFFFTMARAGGDSAGVVSDGAILSPMPGFVVSVAVAEGDHVVKGQKLMVLEAMKMEHGLVSPFDGVVAALKVTEGAQVSEGVDLARIEKIDRAEK